MEWNQKYFLTSLYKFYSLSPPTQSLPHSISSPSPSKALWLRHALRPSGRACGVSCPLSLSLSFSAVLSDPVAGCPVSFALSLPPHSLTDIMVGTPASWPPSLPPYSLKSGSHTFNIIVERLAAFTPSLPPHSLWALWLLVTCFFPATIKSIFLR